jgi:hypothetical protein
MSGAVREPKGARLAGSRSCFGASRVTEAVLKAGLRALRGGDGEAGRIPSTETLHFRIPAAAEGLGACPLRGFRISRGARPGPGGLCCRNGIESWRRH